MICAAGCAERRAESGKPAQATPAEVALSAPPSASQSTPDSMAPLSTLTERQPEPTESASGPRLVDFAPGLRIDYRVPQVEVDCEVILREGDLELFAYARAPVPKEHETILRTSVPAEKIFQALGLIGLQPGKTLKYFHETKTLRPASGDKVDILVRYSSEDGQKAVSACDWMYDVDRKQPMARTHWLFTGSERMEDGTFAANYEGTIVTVVDFPSSLLSLPTSHSDSDDQLWLKANTAAIPAVGTRVVMLLRPAK